MNVTRTARFTGLDVETWKVDGAVLLPSFFSAEEMKPIVEDFERMFSHLRPKVGAAVLASGDPGEPPVADFAKQTQHIRSLPFPESPALSLFPLHPALIEFSKALLATSDVRMYQGGYWPKFTGETNFDQPFHMDYGNHTLTVPGEESRFRSVSYHIYISDVTNAHGAIHYVPNPQAEKICGILRPLSPTPDEHKALYGSQRSGAGPIGSVFAYATDLYHRGTNLTAENGHRYIMGTSYRAAHNDAFDFVAWPTQKSLDWGHVFERATPEQLACLSVPAPGDPFWTELTIARAQNRYPTWNLDAWRRAALC